MEKETIYGKKYDSPIYGVSKEEFDFYESLHKFEAVAFWKGFAVAAVICTGISVLIAILM